MRRSYLISSAAILFLSLFASLTAEPQAVVRPDRLVTISVRADPVLGVPAHTIEIVTDPPIRNITSADLHNRVWTATRVIGSQAAIINSNSCPPLRTIALSFSDLPAVPIRPLASLIAESRPIGPTLKDGYSTSLAFDPRTGLWVGYCPSRWFGAVSPLGARGSISTAKLLADVVRRACLAL